MQALKTIIIETRQKHEKYLFYNVKPTKVHRSVRIIILACILMTDTRRYYLKMETGNITGLRCINSTHICSMPTLCQQLGL